MSSQAVLFPSGRGHVRFARTNQRGTVAVEEVGLRSFRELAEAIAERARPAASAARLEGDSGDARQGDVLAVYAPADWEGIGGALRRGKMAWDPILAASCDGEGLLFASVDRRGEVVLAFDGEAVGALAAAERLIATDSIPVERGDGMWAYENVFVIGVPRRLGELVYAATGREAARADRERARTILMPRPGKYRPSDGSERDRDGSRSLG